jgi:CDP-glycerol glycerophosphotransferase (TagB/SpsB family)
MPLRNKLINNYSYLIFLDEIRPIENAYGLIEILLNSKVASEIIVITKKDNINLLNTYFTDINIKILEDNYLNVLKASFSSNIIFSFTNNYKLLKSYLILSRSKSLVYITPGAIRKAIGFYKTGINDINNKANNIKILLKYMRFLFSKDMCICSNFVSATYESAALGIPLKSFIPIGLPKTYFMNQHFDNKKSLKKPGKGILFAPTHRWGSHKSVIYDWLKDKSFINALLNNGHQLIYQNHPLESQDSLDSRVVLGRNLSVFDLWKDVDVIVTDYSSIGHDFFDAGGKELYHVVNDKSLFEEREGKGPFNKKENYPGIICENQQSLMINLTDKIKVDRKKLDTLDYSLSWVRNLVKHINQ